MAYGSIKVDNIVFTNGGVDQTVTVSGIVQSISGNITATGTIQGATIIGTSTVSGATVTGNVGVFTAITGGTAGFTTVTGATITGTTANFVTVSGTTVTGTTANFGGIITAPTIRGTTTVSGATVTGTEGQFTTVTGGSAGFTTVTGTTVTGTTANFSTLSGTTITGGHVTTASGTYTGTVTAAAFVPTGSGIPTNGVYLPSANNVAISTNSSQRLLIDASGNVNIDSNTLYIDATNNRVGLGTSSPQSLFECNDSLNDIQARFGTLSAARNPIIRLQGRNAANTTNCFADIKLDAENQVLLLSDPGTTGATIGTNPVAINNAGNVGIGTTSPNNSLDVVSDSGGIAVNIRNRSANDYGYLRFQNNAGSSTQASIGNVGGQLSFETGTTERLRITSDGTLRLYNSPGIDFSQIQTNVAGMTSETLDSYEEGTFTPVIEGTTSAGTASYSTRTGKYTKIGNMVTVYCQVTWSSGTGTGNLRVTGLPFTSNENYVTAMGATTGLALTDQYAYGFTSSSNVINVGITSTNGTSTAASYAYDAAGSIWITLTYFVA
jgi:hypothetical protein